MLYRMRKILFAAALFGGMVGTEAQAQFHLLHPPLLLAGPHLFRGLGAGVGGRGLGHIRGVEGGVGLATMGGNRAFGLGSSRMRGRSGREYYAARRYGRYLSGLGYATGGYDNSEGNCSDYRRSRRDNSCD
jgi:hypothetical protein